ncbi:MAG: transcription elongation factor GreA [Candidatus Sumerlaeota bacterium]|nr:transcription elongation factor GreA [Candidatus Sumerlaeota bacterium]
MRNVRSDFEDESRGRGGAGEHYVTAESLRRAREEYQQLKTVDIPANSRAIGDAAALGDLRENADYHAAKERQKMLFARVEELHDQIARARAIDPSTVSTDTIGPGTRVTARNEQTGAEERFTLLGMWDAAPEEHILYYNSPFASQFLGKRAGERFVVDMPSGEKVGYEALAIENALARGSSD